MGRLPRSRVRVAALVVLTAAFVALPASAPQAASRQTAVHTRFAATAAVPADVGQWEAPMVWPLVAVHSVLQPSGSVLSWDGFGNGPNSERLWNPTTGVFTAVPNASNLFCGGQLALADGRTIVVGGHVSPNQGLNETNIFDPATNAWVRGANMSKARWYPTGTTLPDGRVLVVSGDSIVQDNTPPITPLSIHSNTTPEIYDPRTNSWTSLTSAARAMPLYPFMFVLPDGRVLDAGPEQQSRTLDLTTNTWTPLAVSPIDGHSAVMYRPGKVLKTGKWTDPDYTNLVVHGRAAVLDTTVANPAWREVAPMAFPRSYHTLVALPDGNVLAVGGDRTSEGTILANGVLNPEIWNATTETWTTMAPMQTSRLYHSTALLLPDGRILMAGGGALPGSAIDQDSAEVYSPPYLFRGPRPTISSAPATVQYARSFSVATPDAARIASVALVRTAAVTHAFDQNQRYIPLSFTKTVSGVDVTAPANGNVAPPGYYMLFVVDTNGVPSVASFVRLPAPWEDAIAPSAPTGLAATNGVGSIGLMWTAAVDNVGVTSYDIHRSTTPSFTPSAANHVGQTPLTTFTDTGLAPGTYYYVVIAHDAAGNSSPASNVAFATTTGDLVPPTVSITAPPPGSALSGIVAVSANASDNVALGGVRFLADGAAIGAEDTTAPYSVDWNTRSVPNGSHTLTAIARDAAGNVTTSAAVTVTVGNTASSGLVAAYSFEDGSGATVTDVSGNGNTGVITGAAWTAAGRFGNALSFNGTSSDFVTVNDSPSLDLTDAMTLEGWVRPAALGTAWRTVMIKEQPGDVAYGLYAGSDTSVPYGVSFTNGLENQVSGPSSLPLNTWSHLAATYDGTAVRLYVNGSLVSSTPASGPMPNSAGTLSIGGNQVWLTEWFDGLIDELRVYNRALSATEIQGDMNTPVAPPPPPPVDTTPPTTPAGLSATGSVGAVTLTWNASSDNVAVVRYNVHRSTTPGFTPSAANRIAQPTGTSFTESVTPGIYYYRVTAEDAAGNLSIASAEARADATDRTPPSAPSALSATGSPSTVDLSWTASSDNVAVARYNVHRSTTPGFTPSAANLIAQPAGTSYADFVTPGIYYYRVTAEDAAGNVSAASAEAKGDATDRTPPSAPAKLSATGATSAVGLSWTASTDNVGVVRYNVYRSTTPGFVPDPAHLVARPTGTSYADSPLAPGTYYYRVTAEDAAGNVSPASAEAAGVARDGTPPTAPAGVAATGSLGAVSLTWSASSDDVGVVRYNVYRSQTSAFVPSAVTLVAQPTGTSYMDAPLAPGVYHYLVTAQDAAGNVSRPSAEATAIATSDTLPPTAPAGLSARGALHAVTLSWAASTDDVGVVRYNVHRSTTPGFVPDAGNRVAQPTGTSYTDASLAAGTYYYVVTAEDAAGNVSAPSAEATAIAASDTSPPTLPAGVSATGSLGAVSLTWSASSDDVGVVRYNVHRSTTAGFVPGPGNLVGQPAGTTYADSGLTPDVYYYVVTAEDAAGNVSSPSVEVTGNATDRTAPTVPAGLSATGSLGAVSLSWSASTDNVGVVRYNVHRSTAAGFVPSAANLIAQPTGTTYDDSALAPGTYYYVVRAEDAAGNVSPASTEATGIATDNTPPTVPAGVSAIGSPGAVSLSWTGSGDNVGVIHYNVHRSTTSNFIPSAVTLVGQPTGTSYQDSGLPPGIYYYRVTAEDAAGNVSTPSAEVTAIATDSTPPVVALLSPAAGGTVAGSITVSASATDDVAVAGVQFKLDGSNLGAEDTAAPYSVSWDTTLVSDGTHELTAVARDTTGNHSTSVPVSVTVDNLKGLVAAYSFNAGSGTIVADDSGTGNPGTISGATWSASGKFGRALSFSNTGDWVTVSDAASLDLGDRMTIEAWVLASQRSGPRTVAVKEGPGSLVYGLYANSRDSQGNDSPSAHVRIGGTEFAARTENRISQNVWTHLAATYDGSAVRVYVNGNLIASRSAAGRINTSTGALRIGGNALKSEWFRGLIDELRVYNRALSVTEIRADMTAPIGP